MTKTICDICGVEMKPALCLDKKKPDEIQFSISSYGKYWDICQDCRDSLNAWIRSRKQHIKKGE